VAKLITQTPCQGLLPRQIDDCQLSELTPAALTWISVSNGHDKAVSKALKDSCGMAFPAPNRATGKEDARCVWFAGGQAMLVGRAPADIPGAVLCDQSDGWAAMRLKGASAPQVLARLVPVDLRPTVFKRNHTARTLLGHMPVSITCTGVGVFDILVFRSMAFTAVHEISGAMQSVAAISRFSERS
jgi:methylglutamate dehydrogenase subunit D